MAHGGAAGRAVDGAPGRPAWAGRRCRRRRDARSCRTSRWRCGTRGSARESARARPAAAHCSGKIMRAKARWRASSWRWYFDTALIIGSVSGCSLASFCRRSGTSSPLSTRRQNSDGMAVRNGMRTCCATRATGPSIGFFACGLTWVSRRTKRREWRVSSPISCSRYVTRGSVRSRRAMISKLNPAMRTDSKRTPVSTMEANSSRAGCASAPRSAGRTARERWPARGARRGAPGRGRSRRGRRGRAP